MVREDRETTKVRVVYDSATKYGGVSLNDTFSQKPSSPGRNSDRDVFPSHYGKERQAIPPVPEERTRSYQTSRRVPINKTDVW